MFPPETLNPLSDSVVLQLSKSGYVIRSFRVALVKPVKGPLGRQTPEPKSPSVTTIASVNI